MSTVPTDNDLRYPIGRFKYAGGSSEATRRVFVDKIAETPARLRDALQGLNDEQLDTPYREGGWSARQVVHHLGDAIQNAGSRIRWALTEDEPTIKPYDENRWTTLTDAKKSPIEPSLAIFEGATARLAMLMKSFGPKEWARRYYHPESKRHWPLDAMLALTAWHHEHHVAHIGSLRARAGWKA